MMCQKKRTPVYAVTTGMNMKKDHEVTGSKEIEKANPEIAEYEDIEFWP